MTCHSDKPGEARYLLRSEDELAGIVSEAIAHANRRGAPQASIYANETGGMTVRARNGEVDTAVRDGSQFLSVTIHDAGRTGRASTQALDPASVIRTVDQAITIAGEVQPDNESGLPDADWLAWDAPDVPLYAPSRMDAAGLAEAAIDIEAGAVGRSAERQVRVSEAGASSHDTRWVRANSLDFSRSGSASIQRRWCVAIAERDGVMVRDYWSDADRRQGFVMPASAVGRLAADRALRRMGAKGLSTRTAPVLLDARIATTLVGDLCAALGGMAQYQKTTFLPDALGRTALAPHLDLRENPFEPYGLASGAYDTEGVAARQRDIVDGGVIAALFLDTVSARKLGMRSTGSAGGTANLTLSSRETAASDTLEAMLRRMGTGLWITEFLGGGVNRVTGTYSKAASGFWIEGGEIAAPVQDFTVAGNLADMFAGIVAVGADVHREGAIRTGPILLGAMQIAGR